MFRWTTDSSGRRVWINLDNITHVIQPSSGEDMSWVHFSNGKYIEIKQHPTDVMNDFNREYQAPPKETMDKQF